MKQLLPAAALLLLAACAMPDTTRDAAQVVAEPGVELDGPGKRVTPTTTTSRCKVRFSRPAGLPSAARMPDLVIVPVGAANGTTLGPGAEMEVLTGRLHQYRWSDLNLLRPFMCTREGIFNFTPGGAIGSVLPMPFNSFGVVFPRESEVAPETVYHCPAGPCTWRPLSVDSSALVEDPRLVWALYPYVRDSAALKQPIRRAPGEGTYVNLATKMATVRLQFDDSDPAYPTGSTVSMRLGFADETGSKVGQSKSRFVEKKLSDLPKDFLTLVGQPLVLSGAERIARLDGAQFRSGARTVVKFKRLEVDHLVVDGGTEVLVGTFSVTPVDEAANLFDYRAVPTHSGVDLLPGTYIVTTEATDAAGVSHRTEQTVTL